MSDSFSIKFSSNNPWMKLFAFLLYRESCKGVWLGISPKDWHTYIFDYGINVKVCRYWDSGGGQANGLHLAIYKYSEQLHDFHCSYYTDGSKAYMDHLDNIVEYMESYMSEGATDVISFSEFKSTFDVNPDMISTALKTVSKHSISRLSFTAKLLAVMYEAKEEGEHLDIVTKTHTTKEVEALKIYAYLAWLDMERTNYTGC